MHHPTRIWRTILEELLLDKITYKRLEGNKSRESLSDMQKTLVAVTFVALWIVVFMNISNLLKNNDISNRVIASFLALILVFVAGVLSLLLLIIHRAELNGIF